MRPTAPLLIAALALVAACGDNSDARARQFEREAASFGLNVNAGNYTPGQIAAARNIMSSDRSESDKRGLLRSQLSRRGGRVRGLF